MPSSAPSRSSNQRVSLSCPFLPGWGGRAGQAPSAERMVTAPWEKPSSGQITGAPGAAGSGTGVYARLCPCLFCLVLAGGGVQDTHRGVSEIMRAGTWDNGLVQMHGGATWAAVVVLRTSRKSKALGAATTNGAPRALLLGGQGASALVSFGCGHQTPSTPAVRGQGSRRQAGGSPLPGPQCCLLALPRAEEAGELCGVSGTRT